MKKVALLVTVLTLFAIAGTGCKKKEPPPPPMPSRGMPAMPPGAPAMPPGTPAMPPGAPAMPPGAPGMPGAPHGEGAPPVEKKIVVPAEVKGAWKSAKVEVEYKEKKSKKQYTVPLNSEFKVPDSDLKLKIGDFLPHFTMTGEQITSASNNLENPALRVEVFQGGREIFHGWLFAKFPAVHPFQNDKYGLLFLEGVRK